MPRFHKDALFELGGWWVKQEPGQPRFYAYRYDGGRVRRESLGTDDPEQAKRALIERVYPDLARRASQDPEQAFLVTILHDYVENHRGNDATARGHEKLIVGHFGATALVRELTEPAQDEFITKLRKADYSPSYISTVLSSLRAALNRAHRAHAITYLPHIKDVAHSPPFDRPAEPEEIRAFLEAARKLEYEHVFRHCILILNTAGRPEAVLALNSFQIDHRHRLLDFNAPGRVQTKKRRPVVPVTDNLLAWLRIWKPKGPVVAYRGRQIASIKVAWGDVREEAKLDSGFMPKTLRHQVGTELRKRGVPEWEAAGFMGHRSGSRTTEVYAKYRPDYLSAARVAVDAYMTELGEVAKLVTPGPQAVHTPKDTPKTKPRRANADRG